MERILNSFLILFVDHIICPSIVQMLYICCTNVVQGTGNTAGYQNISSVKNKSKSLKFHGENVVKLENFKPLGCCW